MKKENHCSLDEISAYLDGESETPELTAEHLLLCPECMKLYQELNGLSTHLKALPTSDPGPAFVTRVTALAAGQDRGYLLQRLIPQHLRFAPAFVLAAAVICVGVFTLIYKTPITHTPNVSQNSTRVVNESNALADASFSDNEENITDDDLIESIADADWFVRLAADWEADDDVDVIIENMDQDEAEALVDVVREYAQEGLTI